MNIKVEKAKREDGFTLIELLVVVIIIGILAAIAIPVFLNQRTSARVAAVESTLRSAATYQEIVFTEAVDYTTAEADLIAQGFRSGSNVSIDNITVVAGESYCIQASHDDDADVQGIIDSAGDGAPDVDPDADATCA